MRSKNTPNDPDRRERIVTATMTLAQDRGLHAVTARAVAQKAGVPVGSVSYYFDSVRALLLEASRRVVGLRAASLEEWAHTVSSATVIARLAELVHHQLTGGRALTVISYELHVLGLRDEEFRAIGEAANAALRECLADYCPPTQATRLAATADGYQLESLFDLAPPSVDEIITVLQSC